MIAVECRDIAKYFGEARAVLGASFALEQGDFMALLGPSGCGKTTTLRMIAGLEQPTSGEILLAETPVDGERLHVPPNKRNLGMVFQEYALFPHLTVSQNIAYGLNRRDDKVRRVDEMLDLVGLIGFEKRYPNELSGGQQQRVALARALAPQPNTILLDEPFSNLDTRLRVQLREEVRRIIQQAGVSAILVTHDQDEALSMADQIGVMLGGIIQQFGTPRELYDKPNSPDVMLFLGEANQLRGRGKGDSAETILGTLPLRQPQSGNVRVFIRPENVSLTDDQNAPSARIDQIRYFGSHQLIRVRLQDDTWLRLRIGANDQYKVGEEIHIQINGAVRAFPL